MIIAGESILFFWGKPPFYGKKCFPVTKRLFLRGVEYEWGLRDFRGSKPNKRSLGRDFLTFTEPRFHRKDFHQNEQCDRNPCVVSSVTETPASSLCTSYTVENGFPFMDSALPHCITVSIVLELITTPSAVQNLRESCDPLFCWFVLSRNWVPSGEHTKSYGKIHHFLWVNPLFLWPFSIAFC